MAQGTSGGRPAGTKGCQSAKNSSANHAQGTCMHTSEEGLLGPKAASVQRTAVPIMQKEHVCTPKKGFSDQSPAVCKEQQPIMNREYTCTVAKQGLPESRPASLQRTAVLVMNKEHRYTLPEEGLLASRPASVQRTAVAIMHREHACKLAEEGSLESRPASLQRTAVPSIETPAETTQEPRISGACRTIRRRWSKILKAKDRMMTPRKLIKKSPAPYRPAPCSTC